MGESQAIELVAFVIVIVGILLALEVGLRRDRRDRRRR